MFLKTLPINYYHLNYVKVSNECILDRHGGYGKKFVGAGQKRQLRLILSYSGAGATSAIKYQYLPCGLDFEVLMWLLLLVTIADDGRC